jgi:predicted SnoaL-like aldol condensation-catalyzing enzyme
LHDRLGGSPLIIEIGTKVHVVYRALYENSIRRHFLGEVKTADGAVAVLEGYAMVMDSNSRMFKRKPEKRVTIVDLAESGYIVNVIPHEVALETIQYQYLKDFGLVATDGQDFKFDINEFSMKH